MYARILVPIDGSATAQRGYAEALRLAQRLGSALHVVNVVDARLLIADFSGYVAPTELLDDWHAAGEALVAQAVEAARAAGVAVEGVVRCDAALRVCDMILQEARDCGAELIVMGTHGRRGLRRLALGSDAEMVLRDSPVPVLLLRAEEPTPKA